MIVVSEVKTIPAIHMQDSSVHWLNIDDITHVGIEESSVVLYTNDAAYYQMRTFEDYSFVLKQEGFVRTDRASLIRADKATCFDTTLGIVYFDKQPDKHSRYATVAKGAINKLRQMIPPPFHCSGKNRK